MSRRCATPSPDWAVRLFCMPNAARTPQRVPGNTACITTFEIRVHGRVRHRLWLLQRWSLRRWDANGPALYFGRRLRSLARLAQVGYPTGAELHHPPRTPAQAAALAALVAAPRFVGLVVISAQLREELLRRLPGLDPKCVLVAPDGVRSDCFRAPARQHRERPLRAVYCGSFHQGKGIETILLAAWLGRRAAIRPERRSVGPQSSPMRCDCSRSDSRSVRNCARC